MLRANSRIVSNSREVTMRRECRRLASQIVFTTALIIGLVGPARALTISVMIGDDDRFAGSQACNCNPGDAFNPGSVAGLTVLPPGTYTDRTDFWTQNPYTPYIFNYQFPWDASGLTAVSGATVTVQSGSLGRRLNNAGFGFADVSATNGGPIAPLGDFLTTTSEGADEETVKAHVFNVTSLVSPSTTGTLTLTIDGSTLVDPNDLFSFDFAVLEIQGTAAVPEPGTVLLLGSGSVLLGLRCLRRAQRVVRRPASPVAS
jgi:hypothetical protein